MELQIRLLNMAIEIVKSLFDGSTGFNVPKKLADLRLGEAAATQGSGQQLGAWEDSAVVSTQKEKGIPWNLIQKMESSL